MPITLVLRLHRYIGLIAIPFLVISILIAVGLTHTEWLHALSARLFPSAPIPQVELNEPLVPGSMDQVVRLATLAQGSEPQVLVTTAEHLVRVGGFPGSHAHHGSSTAIPDRSTYLIDPATMAIIRIENTGNSLYLMAHNLHALNFFGVEVINIGNITAFSMLLLLLSGTWLGWLQHRQKTPPGNSISRWHGGLGMLTAPLIVIIAITTLLLEFSQVLPDTKIPSHPLAPVQMTKPLEPYSLDQAIEVATQLAGSPPHSLVLRNQGMVKLGDFEGDNTFKAIYLDTRTMTPTRLEDWRNNRLAAVFVAHDGRYLGGMEHININDLAALLLLFITLSGGWIYLVRKKA